MRPNAQPLQDWEGFRLRQWFVTATILLCCDSESGGKARDMSERLFDAGIGNARSNGRYELAYSSTGAIVRAGIWECSSRAWIHGHMEHDGTTFERGQWRYLSGSFSWRLSDSGRLKLDQMRAEDAENRSITPS